MPLTTRAFGICAVLILGGFIALCADGRRLPVATDDDEGFSRVVTLGDDAVAPSHHMCAAIESDDECARTCGCAWCPSGPDEGCRANDAKNGGPCGGRPGRTDSFWSCHKDAVAWLGGTIGAALVIVLCIVAVLLCRWPSGCCRRTGARLRRRCCPAALAPYLCCCPREAEYDILDL
jgi:hypothetical protein